MIQKEEVTDTEVREYKESTTKHKKDSKGKAILYTISNEGCHKVFSHVLDKDGYVRLMRRQKGGMKYLHRLVYESEVGVIPEGYVVMHSCDIPSCINIGHLSVGTNADNLADMKRKGRSSFGERNGRAKLTDEDIIDIRSDGRCALTMAHKYNVTRANIYNIRSRKTWKNI